MSRATFALTLLTLSSACVPRALAGAWVARAITESHDIYGWLRADREPLSAQYSDHLERLGEQLDQVPCDALQRDVGDTPQPIYVLVHGVGGDGPEIQRTRDVLAASHPAAIFLFRWAPWEPRDLLLDRLVTGLDRLAACVPRAPGRLVVIAHSAGGVLASLAASRVQVPEAAPRPWLTVLTVAAPLSGVLAGRQRNADQDLMFFLDLGAQAPYRRAAPGVRVLHLRTQAPADADMKPTLGHVPNDVRVGVPGARQVNLPATTTHAGALLYVAGRLADGSFEAWLRERP